jgi:hypothetical protein
MSGRLHRRYPGFGKIWAKTDLTDLSFDRFLGAGEERCW